MSVFFRATYWLACITSLIASSVALAQMPIGIEGLQTGMTRDQVRSVLANRGIQAKTIDNTVFPVMEFSLKDPVTRIEITTSLRFQSEGRLSVVMFTAPSGVGYRQYSTWLLQMQSQYSSSLRSQQGSDIAAAYWTCATSNLWIEVSLFGDGKAWLLYNAADVAQSICPSQQALWSQSKVAYSFAPVVPAPAPARAEQVYIPHGIHTQDPSSYLAAGKCAGLLLALSRMPNQQVDASSQLSTRFRLARESLAGLGLKRGLKIEQIIEDINGLAAEISRKPIRDLESHNQLCKELGL